MDTDSNDLYVLIGRLYTDIYRSKTVFLQLQAQLKTKEEQILSLQQELAKHKKVLDVSQVKGVVHEAQ